MEKEKFFELFVKSNTKNRDGIHPNAEYKRRYGDVPFEVAFESYYLHIQEFTNLHRRVAEFERFLCEKGIKCENSKISESRYYYYKGVKYRFSSHVYPTGSMTDEILGIVDLCANPELIESVEF